MPAPPDWKPAAWLYGGGLALILLLRLLFRKQIATPAGRLNFGACLLAAGLYGAVIFAAVISPEFPADVARRFGENPGGIPVRLIIWAVVTILYVPLLFGARHVMLFMFAAHRLGHFGALGMIRFYFRSAEFEELRRSRRVIAFCAIYGIVVLVAAGRLGAALHDH